MFLTTRTLHQFKNNIAQCDEVLNKLKTNLLRAQQIQKKYVDQNRKPLEMQVGDKLFVKLQLYQQHSLALRKNQELNLGYFGPFTILQKIEMWLTSFNCQKTRRSI